MSVFVDSSALVALLADNDVHHSAARSSWAELLSVNEDLWTSNYVVVETTAALQQRVGVSAVQELRSVALLVLRVSWVTPRMHSAGLAALLAANRRELSLVDCVSFGLMRELGIESAFTFDPHFREQGFEVLPSDQQHSA
jgi:predicted nucleic acid-binding protein